jgi:hypothetical protein
MVVAEAYLLLWAREVDREVVLTDMEMDLVLLRTVLFLRIGTNVLNRSFL